LKSKTKMPKALSPSAGKEQTTRGLMQHRPSLNRSLFSALAPDSCRGWNLHCLAHIRAQKEPVVSPVGAGIEYR